MTARRLSSDVLPVTLPFFNVPFDPDYFHDLLHNVQAYLAELDVGWDYRAHQAGWGNMLDRLRATGISIASLINTERRKLAANPDAYYRERCQLLLDYIGIHRENPGIKTGVQDFINSLNSSDGAARDTFEVVTRCEENRVTSLRDRLNAVQAYLSKLKAKWMPNDYKSYQQHWGWMLDQLASPQPLNKVMDQFSRMDYPEHYGALCRAVADRINAWEKNDSSVRLEVAAFLASLCDGNSAAKDTVNAFLHSKERRIAAIEAGGMRVVR